MPKSFAALKRLLKGLDDPDSQDPAGFGARGCRSEASRGLRFIQGIRGVAPLPAQPGLQPGRTCEAPSGVEIGDWA